MGVAQIFAFLEVFALAGTWVWVMRRKRSSHGPRRKASIAGFILASFGVGLNVILTLVMHVGSSDEVGLHTYYALIALMTVFALASLVLGILGKGGTRVPTLVWSCIVLMTCFFTLVGIYKAIHAAEAGLVNPYSTHSRRLV